MNSKKIVIDTDPGVDDALAIFMAFRSGIEVAGICTVYGNASVEDTTKNTFTLLDIIGAKIPVYKGAAKPLQGEPTFATAHGESGFGVPYTLKQPPPIEQRSAIEFYRDLLTDSEKNELTIISLGPTTNLTLLAQESPELFSKLDKVIIMGGVVGERGNITEHAEFNVYNDPRALDLLLTLNNIPLVLIPADVCRKVIFGKDVFNALTDHKLAQEIMHFTKEYLDFYMHDPAEAGYAGAVMYDLLTVGYYLDPDLFQSDDVCLSVDLSEEYYGKTAPVSGNANCTLVTDVHALALRELFLNTMNQVSYTERKLY